MRRSFSVLLSLLLVIGLSGCVVAGNEGMDALTDEESSEVASALDEAASAINMALAESDADLSDAVDEMIRACLAGGEATKGLVVAGPDDAAYDYADFCASLSPEDWKRIDLFTTEEAPAARYRLLQDETVHFGEREPSGQVELLTLSAYADGRVQAEVLPGLMPEFTGVLCYQLPEADTAFLLG